MASRKCLKWYSTMKLLQIKYKNRASFYDDEIIFWTKEMNRRFKWKGFIFLFLPFEYVYEKVTLSQAHVFL